MSKEIKDYLHLYLGCYAKIFSSNGRGGVSTYEDIICHGLILESDQHYSYIKEIKPILRHVSSMTIDEMYEAGKYQYPNLPSFKCELHNHNNMIRPETTRYLLSKGFDLFGLIESELAIDATLK